MWKILERTRDVTVYICPRFKSEIKAKIKSYGTRLLEVERETNIRDNIYLSGELVGKRRDCSISEQYLTIKTSKGLVVLTGCAHPGIVEIVQHAKACWNSDAYLLIGGFHLKDHTAEEARNIIFKLKELGVRQIIPFHCTGRVAQDLFNKEYKRDCIIPSECQDIEI